MIRSLVSAHRVVGRLTFRSFASSVTDPHKVLGVRPGASEKEIKDAYRKLCLEFHPDRNPSNRDEAERKFKEVGEAYRMLSESAQKQYGGEQGSQRPYGHDRGPQGFRSPQYEERNHPFQEFRFPGGFWNPFGGTRGGVFNFEDLFGDQGTSGSTVVKEEIVMKDGRPWKRKITKTTKTARGSRTEIVEEDL